MDKEASAANFTHDQKMKAKALNKTQFVALGFVVPRITLGAEYLVFVSSRSLKTREKYTLRQLSLSQFVYFLREVCLLFNF